MMGDDFRRELGRTFDDIAGSPRPGLPDRVRASLKHAPERRGPFWIAGVAAALMAAIAIGVFFVINPLNRPRSTVGPVGASTPSASAAPVASPSPAASPFACSAAAYTRSPAAGYTPPPVAFVDALRTGSHTGYDRLTVEFQNGDPTSIAVSSQSGARFTMGASGQPVTLFGTNGVLVTIRGADLHTSYSGPTDIKTGYRTLVEVRQVQDFEGVVQLGLGISAPVCYRVSFLENPARLVVDVRSS